MIRQPPTYVPAAIARPARRLHPGRDVEVSRCARSEERERDHAHRLLRVVGAVGERDPGAGGELAEPEGAVREAGRHPHEEPVDARAARRRRRRTPITGATRAGIDDLWTRPCHCDARRPRLHERGADEAADQRVRGARRQPEPPGEQVPGDRADQRREDRLSRREAGVDDPLADRLRDRGRDERAGEVRDRRDRDRHRGESARVETEVATALAVSWKPFVKSKPSATTTTTTSRTSPRA